MILKITIISLLLVNIKAAPIKKILILTPMASEFAAFNKKQNNKIIKIEGTNSFAFKIKNKNIIVSTIGIGAVNAAMLSTLLIKKINPDLIIVSGVAGGLQKHIKIGDVVIATKVFSVNFGKYTKLGPTFETGAPINPIKNIEQPLIYKTKIDLIKKNIKFKNTYIGPIATTQNWPNNQNIVNLLHNNNIFAIAMEDAAVAQVCWIFNKPIIVVRGVSDNQFLNIEYNQENVKVAAKAAKDVTIKLIQLLE
jgi:adenosylhomocysteine nucleosidase